MPKLRVSALQGRPLLDLTSYARKGPGRRDRLSPTELAQISRTVRRVPEVMVKVLPKGSNEPSAVAKHLGYIGRYGELAMETDEGEQLQGRDAGRRLLEGWDLDLDEHRRNSGLVPGQGRAAPKLVHKLMLSMPAGTPPQAVLAAARNFLREEFALKHRYAVVLHTDEPHPHVHAVVKAVSEQGERLHIKKATLRAWRQQFARHLREQGVEANATECAVRGADRFTKRDGIYRAGRRNASTHLRDRLDGVAIELAAHGRLAVEPGRAIMLLTRSDVTHGWNAVGDRLMAEGHKQLSADTRSFADRMPPVRTEREWLAGRILEHTPRSPTRGR